MPTLVGTPAQPHAESGHEVVQLQIFVRAEEWEGTFDRIEIWRSRHSPKGPFELLTASWTPAVLPWTAGPVPSPAVTGRSIVLQGEQLLLRVDDIDDFVVTFTTAGTVTYAEAATEISSQGANRFSAYVDGTGAMVLTGIKPGIGASLQITGGSAATLLGLPLTPPESIAHGKDANIALIPDQQQYVFVDLRGSRTCFYRTRFINTQTLVMSDLSAPFNARQTMGVSPLNLVCGYAELVGTDGKPIYNQLVQVYAPAQHQLVDGKLVAAARQAKLTDENGYVSFTLVRGVRYTLSIANTDLARVIVAPVDPTISTFSLFDPTIGLQDDLFKVDRPNLIYAEKMTL
jgi:hypothetical protein